MGAMLFNSVIFTHSHKLADGSVVTHAHPFDSSDDNAPFKTHHHSKTELYFFSHIEILFPLVFILVSSFQAPTRHRFIDYGLVLIPVRIPENHHGRAPPVL
jgi:hypothetical protein